MRVTKHLPETAAEETARPTISFLDVNHAVVLEQVTAIQNGRIS